MATMPDDLTQPVKGLWPRQARFVARTRAPVWIICTVVLLVGAVGMLQLQADGVPSSDLVLGASEARDGQEVLAEHFPAGSGSPVYVIVPEEDLADAARCSPRATASSRWPRPPRTRRPVRRRSRSRTARRCCAAPGPPGAAPPEPTVSEGDVLLVGTLTDAADSVAAEETVRDLRVELDEALGAGTALVGGETATDIDSNDTSIRDRTVIIPVVLLVILVILMLLLRVDRSRRCC